MTGFPGWTSPFAAELARAEKLGFTEWTFSEDAAIAGRETREFIDRLFLFRNIPDASLSFRHEPSAATKWRHVPKAIAFGANTAVKATPLCSLGAVLDEVATWPCGRDDVVPAPAGRIRDESSCGGAMSPFVFGCREHAAACGQRAGDPPLLCGCRSVPAELAGDERVDPVHTRLGIAVLAFYRPIDGNAA